MMGVFNLPLFPSSFLSRSLREQLLKMEEEYIANLCRQVAALKPDLVITEKGLSDLAAHYLAK